MALWNVVLAGVALGKTLNTKIIVDTARFSAGDAHLLSNSVSDDLASLDRDCKPGAWKVRELTVAVMSALQLGGD